MDMSWVKKSSNKLCSINVPSIEDKTSEYISYAKSIIKSIGRNIGSVVDDKIGTTMYKGCSDSTTEITSWDQTTESETRHSNNNSHSFKELYSTHNNALIGNKYKDAYACGEAGLSLIGCNGSNDNSNNCTNTDHSGQSHFQMGECHEKDHHTNICRHRAGSMSNFGVVLDGNQDASLKRYQDIQDISPPTMGSMCGLGSLWSTSPKEWGIS